MTISVEEVLRRKHDPVSELDIRTTTMGINLKDCIDNDFDRFTARYMRR
jgi:uncharacterized protein (UPF0210 family)